MALTDAADIDDLIAWQGALAAERIPRESVWSDCIALALPFHPDVISGNPLGGSTIGALTNVSRSEQRGRRLYDSVGVMAVDRLSSGMESLVTPQSEKWHGLEADDLFAITQSQAETEYFEKYRDYLFKVRYDSRSGFLAAHQKAIRSEVALGDGVVFVEDCLGMHGVDAARVPVRYRFCPINECYMAKDAYGVHNVMFRVFTYTADQAIQYFTADAVSQKIKDAANNPAQKAMRFPILHCCYPRKIETDQYDMHATPGNIKRSQFASVHIELDSKHLIRRSGFYEFPYIIYTWHDGDGANGESAIMLALAELKGMQIMGRTGLRVHQQLADPPLALMSDGVLNRPNLNPRANNPNAIDENGRLKIQPIVTPQLPNVFNDYVTGKREAIKDLLYLNLFAILVQHPEMTATEAMIRANEKGELLGPAGSKIQNSMTALVDRETGILERKGVYKQGSPLEPPASLAARGASFGPRFTSPLDRLRRAKGLVGMQQTLEIASPLMEADPEIKDVFDGDFIVREARDITGAPAAMLKRPEDVLKLRQQRNAAKAPMANAAAAGAAGDAAVRASNGLGAIADVSQKIAPLLKAGQAPPPAQGGGGGGLPAAPVNWPDLAPSGGP